MVGGRTLGRRRRIAYGRTLGSGRILHNGRLLRSYPLLSSRWLRGNYRGLHMRRA
jgi:hypothetical protein